MFTILRAVFRRVEVTARSTFVRSRHRQSLRELIRLQGEPPTELSFGCSQGDLQSPYLPADFFFRLSATKPAESPSFLPPLLEELHCELSSHTALGGSVRRELADQLAHTGIDQGLQLRVRDEW